MKDLAREKIAVVGMAGRFPGAADVESFWQNLIRGTVSIARLSEEELLAAGVSREQLERPDWVRAMGVLDGVEDFDAQFFGFSPREAAELDPQQRLFLECAWAALEDASACGDGGSRAVGVFAGGGPNMYLLNNVLTNPRARAGMGPMEILYANSGDFLTTRVSHRLGLTGPSVTVQTACSSSLVAIHLAAQSLLTFECDLAIAGGVGIHPPQKAGYRHQPGGILSADGSCRPFDQASGGMVPGNGVGAVVLKRLSDALDAGDTIHAVVLGSAIGNDGAERAGFTAPGLEGQRQVIANALAVADVPPDTIGYIEAHGTGTPLGDPIEIAALRRAYGGDGAPAGKTAFVGSVKANIGHLNTAAGVAGFIKAAHVVREGILPPLANFASPNPALELDRSPFALSATAGSFRASPRRAGVSSFGIGGTNAHVVLEEPPAREERPVDGVRTLALFLSAKTSRALDEMTERLATFLDANPTTDLRDAAHSLRVGRRVFEHRRTVVASSAGEAVRAIRERDPHRVRTRTEPRTGRPVGFVFPGQGSQHARMASALYRASPVFRGELDACCAIASHALGVDLRALLLDDVDADAALMETRLAQPAIFAVEYALACMLRSLGVRPVSVAGHSVGEYAAASVAGVFHRDDALRIVVARGALMQAVQPGAMLALPLSMAEAEALLGSELDLAAVNGPRSVVVGGPPVAIEALAERLARTGIATKRLRVSHAFHTRATERAANELAASFRGVVLGAPKLPIASAVTGEWLDAQTATSVAYWCDQIRRPVLFHRALTTLAGEGDPVIMEVGPGQALTAGARQERTHDLVPTMPTPRDAAEEGEGERALASALARVWLSGGEIDRDAPEVARGARRISLPAYPFDRRRHWIEPGQASIGEDASAGVEGALGPSDEAAPEGLGGTRPPLDVPYVAPCTDTERAVAEAWETVLGVQPVGVDDDFFELGGHSLVALRLIARLRERCGVALPIGRLSRAATVRTLAREVDAARAGEVTSAGEEGPQLVTRLPLPDDVRPSADALPMRDPRDWRQVLLTGATGFLGAFLLRDLLLDPTLTVCCAVRARSSEDGLERIRSNLKRYALWDDRFSERIVVVLADLLSPRLGLPEESYRDLAREIDVVVHAGAWVNFTVPYERLAATNVDGTLAMLRFAVAERTKPFHFVSTAAVVSDDREGTVLESDPLEPSGALHTGYATSKWVAEGLVSAAAQRGVPTAIYRPASVAGDSRSGRSNDTDLLSSLIKGVIQLGRAPAIAGHIYATPADVVARAVTTIAKRGACDGRVFNLVPDDPITFQDIFLATRAFGFDVDVVPPDAWRTALFDAAADPAATALYPFLGLIEGGSAIGRARLDNANTHEALRGAALDWRHVRSASLMNALGSWVESGFLPTPNQGEL